MDGLEPPVYLDELSKATQALESVQHEKDDIVSGFIKEKEITDKIHREELQQLKENYEKQIDKLRDELMNEKEEILSERAENSDKLEKNKNEEDISNSSKKDIKNEGEKFRSENRQLREQYESLISQKMSEIEGLSRENSILRSQSDPSLFEDRYKEAELEINRLKGEIDYLNDTILHETQKLKDEHEFQRSEVERNHIREKAEFVKNLNIKFEEHQESNEIEKSKAHKKYKQELKEKIEIVENLWEDRTTDEMHKRNARFEEEIQNLKTRLNKEFQETLHEKDDTIDSLERDKEQLQNAIHVERFELAKFYNRELSLLNRLDSNTEDIEVALIDEVAKLRDEQQKVIRNMEKRHKRKINEMKRKQKPLEELLEQHKIDLDYLKNEYEKERETFEAQLRNEQLMLLKSFEFEKNDIERHYKQIIEDMESEFKQEIDKLQNEHRREITQMGSLEKENNTLKQQLSQLNDKNNDLVDKLELFESENARLKEEIEKQERNKPTKPQNDEKGSDLKTTLEEMSKSNIELANQLEKEQRKCEELFQRTNELEKQLKDLDHYEKNQILETLATQLEATPLEQNQGNLHDSLFEEVKNNEAQMKQTDDFPIKDNDQTRQKKNTEEMDAIDNTLNTDTAQKKKQDSRLQVADSMGKELQSNAEDYLEELKALQQSLDTKDTEFRELKKEKELENLLLQKSLQDLKDSISDALRGEEEETVDVLKNRQNLVKELIKKTIQEEKWDKEQEKVDENLEVASNTSSDSNGNSFNANMDILDEIIQALDEGNAQEGIDKLKASKENIEKYHKLELLQCQRRHDQEKQQYLSELKDTKEAEVEFSNRVLEAICDKAGLSDEEKRNIQEELLPKNVQKDNEKNVKESMADVGEDNKEEMERLKKEKEELENTIKELEKHFRKEKKKLLKKMQTQHKEFVLSPEAEIIEALTKDKAILEEAFTKERFNLGNLYYKEMQDELENILALKKDDVEAEKANIVSKFNADIAELLKALADKDEREVELLKDKNAMKRQMLDMNRKTHEDGTDEKDIKTISSEADKLEAMMPLKKEIAELQRKRQQEHEANAENLAKAVDLINDLIAQKAKKQEGTRRHSFARTDSRSNSTSDDGLGTDTQSDTEEAIDSANNKLTDVSSKAHEKDLQSGKPITNKHDLLDALEQLLENTFGEEKKYESDASSGAISDFESEPATPKPESEDGVSDSGTESVDNECLSIKKKDLELAFNMERFGLGRVYYNEYRDSLKDAFKKLAKVKGQNEALEHALNEGLKDLVDRTTFGKQPVTSFDAETQTTSDEKEDKEELINENVDDKTKKKVEGMPFEIPKADKEDHNDQQPTKTDHASATEARSKDEDLSDKKLPSEMLSEECQKDDGVNKEPLYSNNKEFREKEIQTIPVIIYEELKDNQKQLKEKPFAEETLQDLPEIAEITPLLGSAICEQFAQPYENDQKEVRADEIPYAKENENNRFNDVSPPNIKDREKEILPVGETVNKEKDDQQEKADPGRIFNLGKKEDMHEERCLPGKQDGQVNKEIPGSMTDDKEKGIQQEADPGRISDNKNQHEDSVPPGKQDGHEEKEFPGKTTDEKDNRDEKEELASKVDQEKDKKEDKGLIDNEKDCREKKEIPGKEDGVKEKNDQEKERPSTDTVGSEQDSEEDKNGTERKPDSKGDGHKKKKHPGIEKEESPDCNGRNKEEDNGKETTPQDKHTLKLNEEDFLNKEADTSQDIEQGITTDQGVHIAETAPEDLSPKEDLPNEYKKLKDRYEILKALVGKDFVDQIPELNESRPTKSTVDSSDMDEEQVQELIEEEKNVGKQIKELDNQIDSLKTMSDKNFREEEDKLISQELEALKDLEKITNAIKKEEDKDFIEHLKNEKNEIEKKLEEFDRDIKELYDGLDEEQRKAADLINKKIGLESEAAKKANELDKINNKLEQLQEESKNKPLQEKIEALKEQDIRLQDILESSCELSPKSVDHQDDPPKSENKSPLQNKGSIEEKEGPQDNLSMSQNNFQKQNVDPHKYSPTKGTNMPSEPYNKSGASKKKADLKTNPEKYQIFDPKLQAILDEFFDKDNKASMTDKKIKQAEREKDRCERMIKDQTKRLKPFVKRQMKLQEDIDGDGDGGADVFLAEQDRKKDNTTNEIYDDIQAENNMRIEKTEVDKENDMKDVKATKQAGIPASVLRNRGTLKKIKESVRNDLEEIKEQLETSKTKALKRNGPIDNDILHLEERAKNFEVQIENLKGRLELNNDDNKDDIEQLLEENASQKSRYDDIVLSLPDGFGNLPEDTQRAFELACFRNDLQKDIGNLEIEIDGEQSHYQSAVYFNRNGSLEPDDETNTKEFADEKDKCLQELSIISLQIENALEEEITSQDIGDEIKKKSDLEKLLEEIQNMIHNEPLRSADNLRKIINAKQSKEDDLEKILEKLANLKKIEKLDNIPADITGIISPKSDETTDPDQSKDSKALEDKIGEAATEVVAYYQEGKEAEEKENNLLRFIDEHKALKGTNNKKAKGTSEGISLPKTAIFDELREIKQKLEAASVKLDPIKNSLKGNEIESLEKLEDLITSKHDAKKSIDLLKEIKDLERQKRNLEKHLEQIKLKEEILEVNEVVDKKEHEIERLQDNIRKLDSLLDGLRGDINNNETETVGLEKTLKEALHEIQGKLRELKKENDVLQNEQDVKESELKELSTNLEDDLEESREELEMLEYELAELEISSEGNENLSDFKTIKDILSNKKSLVDYLVEIEQKLTAIEQEKEPINKSELDELRAKKLEAEKSLTEIQEEKSKYEVELQDDEIQETLDALSEEKKELEDHRTELLSKIKNENIFTRMADKLKDNEKPGEEEKKYYNHALSEMIAGPKILIQLAKKNDNLKDIANHQRSHIEDINRRLGSCLGEELCKEILYPEVNAENEPSPLKDRIKGNETIEDIFNDINEENTKLRSMNEELVDELECVTDKLGNNLENFLKSPDETSNLSIGPIADTLKTDGTVLDVLEDQENDIARLQEALGTNLANALMSPNDSYNVLDKLPKAVEIMKIQDENLETVLAAYEGKLDILENENDALKEKLGTNLANALLGQRIKAPSKLSDWQPKIDKTAKHIPEDITLEQQRRESLDFDLVGSEAIRQKPLDGSHQKHKQLKQGSFKKPRNEEHFVEEKQINKLRQDGNTNENAVGAEDIAGAEDENELNNSEVEEKAEDITSKEPNYQSMIEKNTVEDVLDTYENELNRLRTENDALKCALGDDLARALLDLKDTEHLMPALDTQFDVKDTPEDTAENKSKPSIPQQIKAQEKDIEKIFDTQQIDKDTQENDFQEDSSKDKKEKQKKVPPSFKTTSMEPDTQDKGFEKTSGIKIEERKSELYQPGLGETTEADVLKKELEAPNQMAKNGKTLGEIIQGYEKDLNRLKETIGQGLYNALVDDRSENTNIDSKEQPFTMDATVRDGDDEADGGSINGRVTKSNINQEDQKTNNLDAKPKSAGQQIGLSNVQGEADTDQETKDQESLLPNAKDMNVKKSKMHDPKHIYDVVPFDVDGHATLEELLNRLNEENNALKKMLGSDLAQELLEMNKEPKLDPTMAEDKGELFTGKSKEKIAGEFQDLVENKEPGNMESILSNPDKSRTQSFAPKENKSTTISKQSKDDKRDKQNRQEQMECSLFEGTPEDLKSENKFKPAISDQIEPKDKEFERFAGTLQFDNGAQENDLQEVSSKDKQEGQKRAQNITSMEPDTQGNSIEGTSGITKEEREPGLYPPGLRIKRDISPKRKLEALQQMAKNGKNLGEIIQGYEKDLDRLKEKIGQGLYNALVDDENKETNILESKEQPITMDERDGDDHATAGSINGRVTKSNNNQEDQKTNNLDLKPKSAGQQIGLSNVQGEIKSLQETEDQETLLPNTIDNNVKESKMHDPKAVEVLPIDSFSKESKLPYDIDGHATLDELLSQLNEENNALKKMLGSDLAQELLEMNKEHKFDPTLAEDEGELFTGKSKEKTAVELPALIGIKEPGNFESIVSKSENLSTKGLTPEEIRSSIITEQSSLGETNKQQPQEQRECSPKIETDKRELYDSKKESKPQLQDLQQTYANGMPNYSEPTETQMDKDEEEFSKNIQEAIGSKDENALVPKYTIEAPIRMAKEKCTLGEIIKGYESDLETLKTKLGPGLYGSILSDAQQREARIISGDESKLTAKKKKDDELSEERQDSEVVDINGDRDITAAEESGKLSNAPKSTDKPLSEKKSVTSSKRSKEQLSFDKPQITDAGDLFISSDVKDLTEKSMPTSKRSKQQLNLEKPQITAVSSLVSSEYKPLQFDESTEYDIDDNTKCEMLPDGDITVEELLDSYEGQLRDLKSENTDLKEMLGKELTNSLLEIINKADTAKNGSYDSIPDKNARLNEVQQSPTTIIENSKLINEKHEEEVDKMADVDILRPLVQDDTTQGTTVQTVAMPMFEKAETTNDLHTDELKTCYAKETVDSAVRLERGDGKGPKKESGTRMSLSKEKSEPPSKHEINAPVKMMNEGLTLGDILKNYENELEALKAKLGQDLYDSIVQSENKHKPLLDPSDAIPSKSKHRLEQDTEDELNNEEIVKAYSIPEDEDQMKESFTNTFDPHKSLLQGSRKIQPAQQVGFEIPGANVQDQTNDNDEPENNFGFRSKQSSQQKPVVDGPHRENKGSNKGNDLFQEKMANDSFTLEDIINGYLDEIQTLKSQIGPELYDSILANARMDENKQDPKSPVRELKSSASEQVGEYELAETLDESYQESIEEAVHESLGKEGTTDPKRPLTDTNKNTINKSGSKLLHGAREQLEEEVSECLIKMEGKEETTDPETSTTDPNENTVNNLGSKLPHGMKEKSFSRATAQKAIGMYAREPGEIVIDDFSIEYNGKTTIDEDDSGSIESGEIINLKGNHSAYEGDMLAPVKMKKENKTLADVIKGYENELNILEEKLGPELYNCILSMQESRDKPPKAETSDPYEEDLEKGRYDQSDLQEREIKDKNNISLNPPNHSSEQNNEKQVYKRNKREKQSDGVEVSGIYSKEKGIENFEKEQMQFDGDMKEGQKRNEGEKQSDSAKVSGVDSEESSLGNVESEPIQFDCDTDERMFASKDSKVDVSVLPVSEALKDPGKTLQDLLGQYQKELKVLKSKLGPALSGKIINSSKKQDEKDENLMGKASKQLKEQGIESEDTMRTSGVQNAQSEKGKILENMQDTDVADIQNKDKPHSEQQNRQRKESAKQATGFQQMNNDEGGILENSQDNIVTDIIDLQTKDIQEEQKIDPLLQKLEHMTVEDVINDLEKDLDTLKRKLGPELTSVLLDKSQTETQSRINEQNDCIPTSTDKPDMDDNVVDEEKGPKTIQEQKKEAVFTPTRKELASHKLKNIHNEESTNDNKQLGENMTTDLRGYAIEGDNAIKGATADDDYVLDMDDTLSDDKKDMQNILAPYLNNDGFKTIGDMIQDLNGDLQGLRERLGDELTNALLEDIRTANAANENFTGNAASVIPKDVNEITDSIKGSKKPKEDMSVLHDSSKAEEQNFSIPSNVHMTKDKEIELHDQEAPVHESSFEEEGLPADGEPLQSLDADAFENTLLKKLDGRTVQDLINKLEDDLDSLKRKLGPELTELLMDKSKDSLDAKPPVKELEKEPYAREYGELLETKQDQNENDKGIKNRTENQALKENEEMKNLPDVMKEQKMRPRIGKEVLDKEPTAGAQHDQQGEGDSKYEDTTEESYVSDIYGIDEIVGKNSTQLSNAGANDLQNVLESYTNKNVDMTIGNVIKGLNEDIKTLYDKLGPNLTKALLEKANKTEENQEIKEKTSDANKDEEEYYNNDKIPTSNNVECSNDQMRLIGLSGTDAIDREQRPLEAIETTNIFAQIVEAPSKDTEQEENGQSSNTAEIDLDAINFVNNNDRTIEDVLQMYEDRLDKYEAALGPNLCQLIAHSGTNPGKRDKVIQMQTGNVDDETSIDKSLAVVGQQEIGQSEQDAEGNVSLPYRSETTQGHLNEDIEPVIKEQGDLEYEKLKEPNKLLKEGKTLEEMLIEYEKENEFLRSLQSGDGIDALRNDNESMRRDLEILDTKLGPVLFKRLTDQESIDYTAGKVRDVGEIEDESQLSQPSHTGDAEKENYELKKLRDERTEIAEDKPSTSSDVSEIPSVHNRNETDQKDTSIDEITQEQNNTPTNMLDKLLTEKQAALEKPISLVKDGKTIEDILIDAEKHIIDDQKIRQLEAENTLMRNEMDQLEAFIGKGLVKQLQTKPMLDSRFRDLVLDSQQNKDTKVISKQRDKVEGQMENLKKIQKSDTDEDPIQMVDDNAGLSKLDEIKITMKDSASTNDFKYKTGVSRDVIADEDTVDSKDNQKIEEIREEGKQPTDQLNLEAPSIMRENNQTLEEVIADYETQLKDMLTSQQQLKTELDKLEFSIGPDLFKELCEIRGHEESRTKEAEETDDETDDSEEASTYSKDEHNKSDFEAINKMAEQEKPLSNILIYYQAKYDLLEKENTSLKNALSGASGDVDVSGIISNYEKTIQGLVESNKEAEKGFEERHSELQSEINDLKETLEKLAQTLRQDFLDDLMKQQDSEKRIHAVQKMETENKTLAEVVEEYEENMKRLEREKAVLEQLVGEGEEGGSVLDTMGDYEDTIQNLKEANKVLNARVDAFESRLGPNLSKYIIGLSDGDYKENKTSKEKDSEAILPAVKRMKENNGTLEDVLKSYEDTNTTVENIRVKLGEPLIDDIQDLDNKTIEELDDQNKQPIALQIMKARNESLSNVVTLYEDYLKQYGVLDSLRGESLASEIKEAEVDDNKEPLVSEMTNTLSSEYGSLFHELPVVSGNEDNETAEKEKKIEELLRQLEEEKSLKEKYKKDVEELLNDIMRLKMKFANDDEDKEELERQIKEELETKQENKALKEELENEKIKNDKLEEKNSDQNKEIELMKKEIERLEKALENMQKNSASDENKRTIQELEKKNDQLENEIESLKNQLKEHEESLTTEKSDEEGLNDKLKQMKLRNESLKEQLDHAEESMKVALEDYQEQIKGLETENNKIKEEKKHEIDILNNKIALEKDAYEKLKQDYDNILKKEKDRMQDDFDNELEREKRRAKKDIEEQMDDMQRLKAKHERELTDKDEKSNKEKDDLLSSFDKEKQQIDMKYNENIQKLKDIHEKELERLREALEDKIVSEKAELSVQFNQEKNALQAQIEKDIYGEEIQKNLDLENDFQGALNKVLKDHAIEIENIEQEMRHSEENFKKQKIKLLEEFEKEREKERNEQQKHRLELESSIENMLKEIIKLKHQRKEMRHQNRIEKQNMEELFEKERNEIQKSIEQNRNELLAKMREEHELELGQEREKYNEMLKDLQETLDKSEAKRKQVEEKLHSEELKVEESKLNNAQTRPLSPEVQKEIKVIKKKIEIEYEQKLDVEKQRFEETLQGLRREVGSLQEKRKIIQERVYNQEGGHAAEKHLIEKSIANYKMEVLAKLEGEMAQRMSRERKPLEEEIKELQTENEELKRQRWEMKMQFRREKTSIEEKFEKEKEVMEQSFNMERDEMRKRLEASFQKHEKVHKVIGATLQADSLSSPRSPRVDNTVRMLQQENLALVSQNARLESDVEKLTEKLGSFEETFKEMVENEKAKVERVKKIQDDMPKMVTFRDPPVNQPSPKYHPSSSSSHDDEMFHRLQEQDHQIHQLLETKRYYESVLGDLCDEAGLFELDRNEVV